MQRILLLQAIAASVHSALANDVLAGTDDVGVIDLIPVGNLEESLEKELEKFGGHNTDARNNENLVTIFIGVAAAAIIVAWVAALRVYYAKEKKKARAAASSNEFEVDLRVYYAKEKKKARAAASSNECEVDAPPPPPPLRCDELDVL